MAGPQSGTRWVAQSGVHAGTEVEIVRPTDGDRLIVKPIGKAGASWSKRKSDREHVWTLGRDVFERNYAPRGTLAVSTGDPQTSFRRPKGGPKPMPELAQDTRQAPRNGHHVQADMPAGINVSLETITPELAAQWLERGGINRHLSSARVSKLAAAIRRGEWQITGDAIALDADGKVRNGQHRLRACVESGTPIMGLVIRNVAEQAFDVMDTGRSRTVSDVFSIRGYKNIYGLQAAVRNLMLLEYTGRIIESTRESRELVTTVSALAYLETHPEIVEGTQLGDTVRLVMAGGHGLWGAMLTLFLRVNREATYEFQDRLVNGEALMRGDPILVLRNHQLAEMRQFITRDAAQKEILGGTIIRAWNLWRAGERVESWAKLAWRPGREPFPSAT